jgi:hypothetical protein
MELKIVCDCGQKYKFDVEPVNGQVPFKVNCPTCGIDGTDLANGELARMLSSPAPPVPQAPAVASATVPPPPLAAVGPSAGGLRINRAAPAPTAPAAPPPISSAPRPIAPLKPLGVKPNLTWYQYLWIGLPLLLIAIGGAIGGACGGAACAINRTVFLKVSNPVLKYVWTGMISAAAFAVWFIIAAVLFGALHGLGTR